MHEIRMRIHIGGIMIKMIILVITRFQSEEYGWEMHNRGITSQIPSVPSYRNGRYNKSNSVWLQSKYTETPAIYEVG
jgi:hypothetical protein